MTGSLQLQVALDRIPLDRAESITRQTRGDADWIEVGTSLIKRYGMDGVRRIVAAADGTPVLADFKTADDAKTEVAMAAEAGARSITVLGLSAPGTLRMAVEAAGAFGIELMVDLMELDREGRVRVAGSLPGSTVLAAHIPKDAQTASTSPTALLGEWAVGRRLAVAGGLSLRDVPALARLGDTRLIIGSAITAAADPAAAAAEFRAAITASEPALVESQT